MSITNEIKLPDHIGVYQYERTKGGKRSKPLLNVKGMWYRYVYELYKAIHQNPYQLEKKFWTEEN